MAGILRSLPPDIAEGLHREGPPLTFNDFSKWMKLDREDNDINRHVIYLNKLKDKRNANIKIHRKKKLPRIDRKKLGLYSISKTELSYSDMLTVHYLWASYMARLLDVEHLEKSGWDNRPQHPQFDQINLKLYRADYHGAHVTVIKSSCPSLVGCTGLVAMETKNCFRLLGEDDITRTIPKKSCQFQMELGRLQFTFHGHNFIVRPADRSNKKIKNIKPPIL